MKSLLLTAFVSAAPANLTKYMIDDVSLGASCMDGTKFGYYFKE